MEEKNCWYWDSNQHSQSLKPISSVPQWAQLQPNTANISAVRNIRPLHQSLCTRLRKLINVNSCFNFKLSKCIGVSGWYICGANECNEWETQKCHECINMGKIQMSQITMATVLHVTSVLGLRQFQAARFLLDRAYYNQPDLKVRSMNSTQGI